MAEAPIVRFDEIDSTQREARERLAQGAPHGTLVVARRQSAGRGRLSRAWRSDEGGLWLSMIVRGALPAAQAPRLTLAAAALAVETLDELAASRGQALRAGVKWPNDLMLPHPIESPRLGPWRKVGGLLLEGVDLDATTLKSAVLGLGLNVRRPADGFGPQLEDSATSLQDAGLDVNVDEVLDALGPPLQRRLLHAAEEAPFAEVLDTLRARSATLGRRVTVEGVVGRADALLPDGALRVLDDHGNAQVIRAGDVWLADPATTPP
ncbi:MAG: biotin--[acetyl-CoA-carboxylase] ligase [Deltaproteobacteria bacterium]|nr:biotin--[acetyl-CoA-carboxylase] ligase [Deltaproteobacteria bacterium]